MTQAEGFDQLYKQTRDRLLVQAYLLTGDAAVARSAVRDTFIEAWHHWPRVERSGDAESWVRPRAWAHAQRRHTARPWHREKDLPEEVRALLDGLGTLPTDQRRLVLLSLLAPVSLEVIAREVGLPRERVEERLQLATSDLALALDVPSASLPALVAPVEAHLAGTRWPRPTILRRAGVARRRTHAVAGVAAVLGLLATAGVVASDGAAEPRLDRALTGVHVDTPTPTPSPGTPTPAPEPDPLPATALLDAGTTRKAVGGPAWSVDATDDNTRGDGSPLPCQTARYADPRAAAALVRRLSARPSGRARPGSDARVVQLVEVSRNDTAAGAAFDTASSWFAGCQEPRVQLTATVRIDGLADQARLFRYRDWSRGGSGLSLLVARTGRVVTAVSVASGDTGLSGPVVRAAPQPGFAQAVVAPLCALPDGGTCPSDPERRTVRPLPAGPVPGLLVEADLPPVGVASPWVGAEPATSGPNTASTRCDRTDFGGRVAGGRFSDRASRTFLLPGADLPVEFGLSQSAAMLPEQAARAFIAGVRAKLASCSDRDLGADVTSLGRLDSNDGQFSAWRVRIELSDTRSVTYLMAVARRGRAVTQIGFIPARDAAMGTRAFLALAERAVERLPDLGTG